MAKRKVGKPKFEPDYVLLEKIAGLFPTDEEIASVLGCSPRTIHTLKHSDQKYMDVVFKAQQGTKMKLRQLQFKQAMEGNTTMLIFLGKQKLGQADTVKHQGDATEPVVTVTKLDLTEKQLATAIKALKSPTE